MPRKKIEKPEIIKEQESCDFYDIMEKNYIDYAMSVITDRALADIRDNCKPVQRRVLYSMYQLNLAPDKPHRKCARIVGDCMGKYHQMRVVVKPCEPIVI